MPRLTAEAILSMWESRPDQGTRLLAHAFPELASEAIAEVSVGQRDALLLQLWHASFGPSIETVASCPSCNETLEVVLDARSLLEGRPEPEAEGTLESGEWRIEFRLPCVDDMEDAARLADANAARSLLLERSLMNVTFADGAASPGDLPDDVVTLLAEHLATLDSLAEVLVTARCPVCAHAWQSVLEINRLIRQELTAEALRLLEDVHRLAAAYSWHERDILAMSDRRREAYLELAGV